MKSETIQVEGRSPAVLMEPRRLGSLQPTRLSAARSFYSKMARENWQISIVREDLDKNGAGEMLYRIDANGHIMHAVAFSYEPKMVNRSPRIIGSSWDLEGAIIDGEVSEAELEETKHAIPRLYAGRTTPNTLVWFRANRSIRLFDEVVNSLENGQQPDTNQIEAVGYLLRNTGLDGNGTFGTVDFQDYAADHPLAIPYHAQLFTAFMMREISVDLANRMASLRNPNATQIDFNTRKSIAVGNGSALGLVLLAMNRPHLVNAWLSGYETLRTKALQLEITENVFQETNKMLLESIDLKEADETDYGVFPSGEALSVDLKQIRKILRKTFLDAKTQNKQAVFADVIANFPSSLSPESEELFTAIIIEFMPQEETDELSRALKVDERKQVNPLQTIGELKEIIETDFAWIDNLPEAEEEAKTRIWYKSRNSEEPRSGPHDEVPNYTNDLAVDLVQNVKDLKQLLNAVADTERVGRFVAKNQTAEQTVGYIQNLAGLPYATPHMDVRDKDFVPAHIVRLFNGFCFGLEKTHDVHQRNLRGVIFEKAHFFCDLNKTPNDWRWRATGATNK